MATPFSTVAWKILWRRGAWWTTVHEGHKESDMTEQLTIHIHNRSNRKTKIAYG